MRVLSVSIPCWTWRDLFPAADLLVHFAHWITPANQPKRYDTQFFLAEAPGEHLAVHDGHEAVELMWVNPAKALDGAVTAGSSWFSRPPKTSRNLAGRQPSRPPCDAAIEREVVTVQPVASKLEGTKRLLRIPVEADYGGSEFVVDMAPAS